MEPSQPAAHDSTPFAPLSEEERLVLNLFWAAWPKEAFSLQVEYTRHAYRPERQLIFATSLEDVVAAGTEATAFIAQHVPNGIAVATELRDMMETLLLYGAELALTGLVAKAEMLAAAHALPYRQKLEAGIGALNARGWLSLRDGEWVSLSERGHLELPAHAPSGG